MKTLLVILVALRAASVLAQGQAPHLLIADSQPLGSLNPGLSNIFAGRNGSGSLDTRSLFSRQLTCPVGAPVMCSGGCCQTGNKCCPTDCCPLGGAGNCCGGSLGGCCATTDNCVEAKFRCCPKTAETCGGNFCYDAGAICCNGGTTACKAGNSCCGTSCCGAGTTCCSGEGCCTAEETCCPGGCCPAGYKCGTEPGKCQRIQTTQQTKTQTQTSKSQMTKPPATTKKPTPTTAKLSTPKTASGTTTGCRTATGISQPTSASLPVMEFIYVGNGIADNIPTNICLGIRYKLGSSAQEIVLTRALDGEKCSRARGRASGCPGCCSGVRKPASSPNAGDVTECDEFPFKSTIEGGTGAWIRCVTGWQNRLQGSYINSWYADHGVGAGDQFIVRVVNLDCATVKLTDLQSCNGAIVRPRDAGPETPGSGAETTIHRTLDNRTSVVVASLGDLDSGRFQATARVVSGRLRNLALLDGDGEEIVPPGNLDTVYSTAGLVMNWELDEYVGGIGLLGETESTSVNLTWELANSTGSQTGSKNRGGVLKGVSPVGLIVSLAALGFAMNFL